MQLRHGARARAGAAPRRGCRHARQQQASGSRGALVRSAIWPLGPLPAPAALALAGDPIRHDNPSPHRTRLVDPRQIREGAPRIWLLHRLGLWVAVGTSDPPPLPPLKSGRPSVGSTGVVGPVQGGLKDTAVSGRLLLELAASGTLPWARPLPARPFSTGGPPLFSTGPGTQPHIAHSTGAGCHTCRMLSSATDAIAQLASSDGHHEKSSTRAVWPPCVNISCGGPSQASSALRTRPSQSVLHTCTRLSAPADARAFAW